MSNAIPSGSKTHTGCGREEYRMYNAARLNRTSRPKMVTANGTDNLQQFALEKKPHKGDGRTNFLPGIKFCIVRVIVSVVIKALSAAGSSMVPRTVDMRYRRAR
jgi:hypothetical protein